MASTEIRGRRRTLRYRKLLVRQNVQLQDTQRHSKTLGNYPKSNFSTLASTLIV
jgi:hypothetical protein